MNISYFDRYISPLFNYGNKEARKEVAELIDEADRNGELPYLHELDKIKILHILTDILYENKMIE